ncbi:rod shape-determining protein MreC [Salinisphaera orenii]|uniref:Cell shape-determining protein MreC n=1 Tax=Salinisphaera orenii YIM 95161 TaxID=1051139 RepID=A0A423PHK0_9GAMM|nr:rod shape-determining protein MreC [Salinisphaera halophila]ROO25091.1 rod shape-determining protein MreC [Salinisphaera halophila YIM 95161]
MRGFADDEDNKGPLLGRRVSPGIKIVAIAIVSVVLMMVDNAHDALAPVRGTLAIALQPVQIAAEMPGDVADYLGRYFNRGELIEDNEALNRRVLLLRARLQRLAALEAENERIRALLASASSLDQNVLIARVLSVTPDPYRHRIKLNKGSSDGVFKGQALIDANGIMGQVTDVTPLDSRAILITDANHGIPVEINRTGLQTIAQGTGRSDELRLPFLANNADVQSGDLLVSSGLGGRYPAGYPVGRVEHVDHKPGDEFLDVVAEPTAHLNRGREVLLVWTSDTARKADQPPADESAAGDADDAGATENRANGADAGSDAR